MNYGHQARGAARLLDSERALLLALLRKARPSQNLDKCRRSISNTWSGGSHWHHSNISTSSSSCTYVSDLARTTAMSRSRLSTSLKCMPHGAHLSISRTLCLTSSVSTTSYQALILPTNVCHSQNDPMAHAICTER